MAEKKDYKNEQEDDWIDSTNTFLIQLLRNPEDFFAQLRSLLLERDSLIERYEEFKVEPEYDSYCQTLVSKIRDLDKELTHGVDVAIDAGMEHDHEFIREFTRTYRAYRISGGPTAEPVKNLFSGNKVKWRNIEIDLVSDESIRVKVSALGYNEKLMYPELGMKDKRKGDLPIFAWTLLKELAETGGTTANLGFQERGKIEKHISRLRIMLREVFGLSGDPIPFNRHNKNYHTAFKISDKRPFPLTEEHRTHFRGRKDSYKPPDYDGDSDFLD